MVTRTCGNLTLIAISPSHYQAMNWPAFSIRFNGRQWLIITEGRQWVAASLTAAAIMLRKAIGG